jgi:hypothetical protein
MTVYLDGNLDDGKESWRSKQRFKKLDLPLAKPEIKNDGKERA